MELLVEVEEVDQRGGSDNLAALLCLTALAERALGEVRERERERESVCE